MRRLAPLAALGLLVGCAQSAERETGLPADFALNATTIALPAEPVVLPPSAETVSLHCTACHSGEMILAQPPLDAKKWQAEIDKMRTVFKAGIDPADDAALVAELLALHARVKSGR